MTVDLNNESGLPADGPGLVRLATFALDQLRIHPLAELSVVLVDEETMSAYHQKYMGEPGPTDVLSFPMDELRPPNDDEDPPAGLLGDIVLCPAVTARQATEHGRTPEAEAEYLLVHGLLHLLGFDHAEPDERTEMFALKDTILARWASARPDPAAAPAYGDDLDALGPAGDRAGPGRVRRVHRRRRGRSVLLLQVPGRSAGG